MIRKLPFLFDITAAMGVSTARALGSLASFGLTMLAAKVLGPADSGMMFVSITWAMGLAIVARWGASDLILLTLAPLSAGWRSPTVPAIFARHLSHSLVRTGLVALPLVGLAIANRSWNSADFGLAPLFVVALLFLTVLQQLLAALSRALGAPMRATFFEFLFAPAGATAAYFALDGRIAVWTIREFELLYLGAIALSLAGLLSNRGIPRALGRPIKPKAIRSSLRRANDFALIEASGFLLNWSSLLLMPLLLSVHDAGLLNPALRIAGMVGIVAVSIPAVFVPRLVIAQARGDAGESARLIRTARLIMGTSAAAFFVAILVGGGVALRFLGEEFHAAYVPLLLIAGGQCGSLALGPSGAVLGLRGHERISRNIVMVGGLASLLASVPAILAFGLYGAAAAAALGPLGCKIALRYYEGQTTPRG